MLFNLLAAESQTRHTIGEKFGGGIVFSISKDGQHGLIAETIDQGKLEGGIFIPDINDPKIHSKEGKNYTDWRLPTLKELILLREQKSVIGNFNYGNYWSSTKGEYEDFTSYALHFSDGTHFIDAWYNVHNVRVIRDF